MITEKCNSAPGLIMPNVSSISIQNSRTKNWLNDYNVSQQNTC